MPRTILVTGAAGFIGFHTARRFLQRGDRVVGVDNLNGYYDVSLKKSRLGLLKAYENFSFVLADLSDRKRVEETFRAHDIDQVVHLAAQVGVRASIEAPHAYMDSNIVGFLNILESCRHYAIQHLLYASSSSVYGNTTKTPSAIHDRADQPISLYAATKRANELMAHSYSHLFGMSTIGLRFFTVYGPWGRPDMALFLFASAIVEGQPIKVFNDGDMIRDFTYIDDVVESIVRVLERNTTPGFMEVDLSPHLARSTPLYKLYNVGSSAPTRLTDMIDELESALGRRAKKELLPLQAGDVRVTHADVSGLINEIDYRPTTSLRSGVCAFVDWYCDYYGVERW